MGMVALLALCVPLSTAYASGIGPADKGPHGAEDGSASTEASVRVLPWTGGDSTSHHPGDSHPPGGSYDPGDSHAPSGSYDLDDSHAPSGSYDLDDSDGGSHDPGGAVHGDPGAWRSPGFDILPFTGTDAQRLTLLVSGAVVAILAGGMFILFSARRRRGF
ncbi:hypothetical protein [Herbidospora mongoliensis]|uniref:hypothetical protein n=1 Tax=Herbidospora mongoliensis TaxID=688067 RepID=UPI0012FBDF37|nr:hypothetical protein [Herbidospora mongoliensis]